MEGTLFKWTNYLSGWQPRWFILENGILSYYKSQEVVNSGCKGSIKMTVCDVVVHPSDSTRLDLVIPGEQHFYLKAATPHERQQWLIALGTSKACLANGQSPQSTGEISPDIVKTKKSELRLYCDLLMKQVHSVKQAISNPDETPDIQKLNDATSLLSATCDTFIQTLEDCMRIANATIAYEVPNQYVINSSIPISSPTKSNYKLATKNNIRKSISLDRPIMKNGIQDHKSMKYSNSDQYLQKKSPNRMDSVTSDSSDCQISGCEDNSYRSLSSDTRIMPAIPSDLRPHHISDENLVIMNSTDTYFSYLTHSFATCVLDSAGEVPVEPFLDSCKSILPIFDKLNSTAFATVKMDFSSNIQKIEKKYATNSEFTTLQKMITWELEANEQHLSNSVAVAVLWMKRALEFIREFISEIHNGKADLSEATTEAYNRTLKPFHTRFARSIFDVAMRAIPTRDMFLAQLHSISYPVPKEDIDRILDHHMVTFINSLKPIIQSINDFYCANNLDSEEQV
ncbi:pleckstrin homology domain-containing family A member 8-like [Octopus vulgaris]|uniref:Pleckstrin homology domain-containing family A member 8-like n=2 Tax=Octopus TaxID=6643 RepID=A0AA36EYL0_OCTVU|nr:pleckstrin homology domain-containing family A member 8-like [Octopus sinensis]CAI9718054.1 pleckstrin homology domain-containing family A member 8-like [Octopus vulgaris]